MKVAASSAAVDQSAESAFRMGAEEIIASWQAVWTELERLHGVERQHIEESQQLAATIMRNMATGLVMLNARGLVTESNPAAQAVLGHASLVGRHYREIFWPDYRGDGAPPPGLVGLEDCLHRGSTLRRLQMNYRAPGGQNMVLGVGFSPIRSSNGAVGGAICLLTDLTEITALQQQVRLKENLAALGAMSAGIAHEFKNSLATISGYAQLIQSSDPEEAKLFASKIHNETRFLSQIVTDFLHFSRPLNLVAVPVDTRKLVDESFAEIRDRADFPGLHLEMEGDFPVLQADATLLRQAFSNLLRNSCEALAEHGGGRLLVRSKMENGEGGPVATMEFYDEGGGIPAGNLDKVFIPFFTTKDHGTGLGLALVHKIIVNHNGKIAVESAEGKGTTFTVTLPLGT